MLLFFTERQRVQDAQIELRKKNLISTMDSRVKAFYFHKNSRIAGMRKIHNLLRDIYSSRCLFCDLKTDILAEPILNNSDRSFERSFNSRSYQGEMDVSNPCNFSLCAVNAALFSTSISSQFSTTHLAANTLCFVSTQQFQIM